MESIQSDKIKVTIVYRNGWSVRPITVEISDKCPVCGGPRGKPTWHHFCEDGEWYSVNVWKNDCGHVDMYKDVLAEVGITEE